MFIITGIDDFNIVDTRSYIIQCDYCSSVDYFSSEVFAVNINSHITGSISADYHNDCSVSLINDFDIIGSYIDFGYFKFCSSIAWSEPVSSGECYVYSVVSNIQSRNDKYSVAASNINCVIFIINIYGYISVQFFRSGNVDYCHVSHCDIFNFNGNVRFGYVYIKAS